MSKMVIAVFLMALLACACGKSELVAIGEDSDSVGRDVDIKDTAKEEKTEPQAAYDEAKEEKEADALPKYVYICGAVNKPGVYEIEEDDRLFSVLKMAGGESEDAALDYVNLAQAVIDGSQIVIPSNEDIEKIIENGAVSRQDILEGLQKTLGGDTVGQTQEILESGGGNNSNKSGLVNINTADAATLQTLSGIGAKRANDIIAYRNEHGEFKSIEDIKNVAGIKGGIFDGIKDFIAVG